MFNLSTKASSWSLAFALATGLSSAGISLPLLAEEETLIEEVVVTGSRIRKPGAVSTSPIYSVDIEEISFQQETEVANILRELPSTIPGDGENVNNGTSGAATVDLRGLGPERTLLLMNGRRMTPFNHNGRVDTSSIPVSLIERIDIVTGGASAVYGSDAVAGAVNIVMRDDFEGLEFSISQSETGDRDGEKQNVSLTLGSALTDGKGNIAMNMSWANREAVLLGQRRLGNLGINTADGGNLSAFNAGLNAPLPATAGCDAPGAVEAGGSTTSIPTRINIAGAGNVGQFLNDRSIFTGNSSDGVRGGCSRFNFNPFNYYRTPSERYNALIIGNFEFNENFDVYATVQYSNITVDAQVAPSGTFGARFNVPLANPFFSDAALSEVISFANAAVALGTLSPGNTGSNWNDVNGNGVVDSADYLKLQLRRRTLELGPRSERWDNEQFTFLAGARGEIPYVDDWEYDVSYQYGESNRTTTRDGYTNLVNIQNALDTTDGITCANGDATCVPIDIFGGFGTITPAMAAYARAIALQQQKYEQKIAIATVNGPIAPMQLPWASNPLSLSFGFEKRQEEAILAPDECLKLAPASCQGGAGGNLLPIAGGFSVDEWFVEGYMPLIEDAALAQSLAFEFGYRTSDYDTTGSNSTWKAGLNWNPIDSLLVRVMQQEATRAPNVGELFSPVTTGLANALQDPCSVANAANIDATLSALCVSTGLLPQQVGMIQDIVSGQINVLAGSNPISPPDVEIAETFTFGFVWTPNIDFGKVSNFSLTVDYYDIDIDDLIGNFSAQEVLNQCYIAGDPSACASITRVDGDLTTPASGVQLFTTNLTSLQAEGIEVSFGLGFDLGKYGDLQFSGNINKYLTNESQSTSTTPIIDCNGFFGTSCNPVSKTRWVQRSTWNYKDLIVSLQWRHVGEVKRERPEIAAAITNGAPLFAEFTKIDSQDYLDLYVGYSLWDDRVKLSLTIDNITDEDPPVVGNEAGTTSFNSGNTFPSNYDTLGTIYTAGFTYKL